MKPIDEIVAVINGESEGCVVCGDCHLLLPLIPDGVAHVLTDWPYNEVNRDTSGLREIDKGSADSAPVDVPFIVQQAARVLSGSCFFWCGVQQLSGAREILVALGLTTRLCIWEKSDPSPMNGERLWLSSVEACVFGRKPKATFNRHCASPVWRGPSVKRAKYHPCEKPLWLILEQSDATSSPGDIILDPFCGSGTTCVAAKKLGRRYIGIDIEPKYVQIAKNRLRDAERPLFT